jgi:hypothetical protein
MDDIERMYRHLVRTIRASFTPLLTQPFEVGELYQTILPYRLHRRELGLETNQDYEMALLELLSGSRGYLIVDDRMRDVLATEQSAKSPDPSIVRTFASAHVALAPEPLQRLEAEGRATGVHTSIPVTAQLSHVAPAAAAPSTAPRPAMPTPSAGLTTDGTGTRRTSRQVAIASTGERCSFCRGELPAGHQISFCPHCGQDLTVVHCPACGSALELGWRFCVTCGRSAQDL